MFRKSSQPAKVMDEVEGKVNWCVYSWNHSIDAPKGSTSLIISVLREMDFKDKLETELCGCLQA